MTNEELNKINSIMKKVFIISFAVYALFVFCLYYFCSSILTPTQLILIIIFAPMVIGLVILFVYKIKHPPVLDESIDEELEQAIEDEESNQ